MARFQNNIKILGGLIALESLVLMYFGGILLFFNLLVIDKKIVFVF